MAQRPSVYAVSDLHVDYKDNLRWVDKKLHAQSNDDWLIVAGDVGEGIDLVIETLEKLSRRYAKIIWVPGNHELWVRPRDVHEPRGAERYNHLVDGLRSIGVTTPEDPYPVWDSQGKRPLTIVPLFLLYDYSWRPSKFSVSEAIEWAMRQNVLCSDEFLLLTHPYESSSEWCHERVRISEHRLTMLPHSAETLLVNHFPLDRSLLAPLKYPAFSLWCGTELTQDWPTRFNARTVVYGHTHIPRSEKVHQVMHYEVSLGYPQERHMHGGFLTGPTLVAEQK